jgi:ABC-type transport system substrate-binding protein
MAASTEEQRRALYVQAERLIAEDAPYISLWYKTNVAVSGTQIEGVKLTPSADFTFLRDVTKH